MNVNWYELQKSFKLRIFLIETTHKIKMCAKWKLASRENLVPSAKLDNQKIQSKFALNFHFLSQQLIGSTTLQICQSNFFTFNVFSCSFLLCDSFLNNFFIIYFLSDNLLRCNNNSHRWNFSFLGCFKCYRVAGRDKWAVQRKRYALRERAQM